MSAGRVYLDEGMRGWIAKTARNQYWRVAGFMEFEDLVQEGYLAFAKCVKSYPQLSGEAHPTKDQRRHFMSLVQVTFQNQIETLATKKMRLPETPISALRSTSEDGVDWDDILPQQPENQTFLTLLAAAPMELSQLIKLLATDTSDLLGFERRRVGRRKVRETTNEFYCRLVGLDPKQVDLVGRLKSYFGT